MVNRAGFVTFIRAAGINTTVLPDNSADIDAALALSLQIVYAPINDASPLLYEQAVYSLGVSNLIEFANDQTGQTFFSGLRTKYNINGFVPGTVQSASDEGTSTSMLLPDFMKNLMLADLQYIKTPWGRNYMAIAQRIGPVWGMS